MKSVKEMTAEEYGRFLREQPEEAKKLDEKPATQGYWRNGQWVTVEQKPAE